MLTANSEGDILQGGKPVGTSETVNVFRPDSMAPIWRRFATHAEAPGQEEETIVEFHGQDVHVSSVKNGQKSEKTFTMECPVFDFNGGLYGLIFAAMDLKEGLSGNVPSLSESDCSPSPEWIHFTVGGIEDVDAGAVGKVKAAVVNADTEFGPMKFWISRNAPYIIRLEFKDVRHGNLFWSYRMI